MKPARCRHISDPDLLPLCMCTRVQDCELEFFSSPASESFGEAASIAPFCVQTCLYV
jgi:hypothetical protein